jgi:hypothetical protein
MSEQPAYQTIDPELVNVACHLAGCQPEQLLAVAQRDDTLVVVVQPGPKYVYSAEQIAQAVKEMHHRPAHAAAEDAPPKKRKAG